MKIGDKLRQLRQEKHMSAEQVGLMIGTSAQAIYQYEYSVRTPKVPRLKEFAEIFNIPITELIECDFD